MNWWWSTFSAWCIPCSYVSFSSFCLFFSTFFSCCNPSSFWWPLVRAALVLLSNWLVVLLGAWLLLLLLLLTPISVSLFTQNPPPKTLHAKPTSKFGPQIRPVSKLRLKVDEPQIGVELRPNLVLKSGQRGQKRPFVVILNYPASMSACMCFPSFPLNRGSLAPETEMGWRQRPSIDSTCSDYFCRIQGNNQ